MNNVAMKTQACFFIFLVTTATVVDSNNAGGLNALAKLIQSLQEDVEALQDAPTYDDDIATLQTQVSVLQNRTDEQQATLDTLTSECDCQSFQQRLDSLDASVATLQELVNSLTATPTLNGTLRLVNTVNAETNQGRLEIFLFDEWGTICQDFWSKNDAIVACNQLGLPSGDPVALKGTQSPMSPFGQGTGPIWLDNLLCDGPEASLLDCRTNGDGPGRTNCDHSQDVGLICRN